MVVVTGSPRVQAPLRALMETVKVSVPSFSASPMAVMLKVSLESLPLKVTLPAAALRSAASVGFSGLSWVETAGAAFQVISSIVPGGRDGPVRVMVNCAALPSFTLLGSTPPGPESAKLRVTAVLEAMRALALRFAGAASSETGPAFAPGAGADKFTLNCSAISARPSSTAVITRSAVVIPAAMLPMPAMPPAMVAVAPGALRSGLAALFAGPVFCCISTAALKSKFTGPSEAALRVTRKVAALPSVISVLSMAGLVRAMRRVAGSLGRISTAALSSARAVPPLPPPDALLSRRVMDSAPSFSASSAIMTARVCAVCQLDGVKVSVPEAILPPVTI